MRGHTHLWGRKIEGGLHRNDEHDLPELNSSERRMMIAQKRTGPCANHSHDGARRADKLVGLRPSEQTPADHTGAGADPREKIAGQESPGAD